MLTIICSLYLLAFVTSQEQLTTANLTVYATSAFQKHSLVATVLVVQNVVNGKCSYLLYYLRPLQTFLATSRCSKLSMYFLYYPLCFAPFHSED